MLWLDRVYTPEGRRRDPDEESVEDNEPGGRDRTPSRPTAVLTEPVVRTIHLWLLKHNSISASPWRTIQVA